LLGKLLLLSPFIFLISINIIKASDTIYIKNTPEPYRITHELLIPEHQTLIIEAGATIEIADSINMVGMGSIIARGHKDKPITIRPLYKNWNHIRMLREADSLVLEHVIIIDGSIYTHDCHAVYKNCEFKNSRSLEWNQSISSNHGGSLLIDGCKLKGNNTGEGFLCHNLKAPLIKNCKIEKTPDAIEFIQCRNGIIKDNIISNAHDDGIDLNACINTQILQNNISNISDKGIEIGQNSQVSSTSILIDNNNISNTYAGIHLMQKSDATITRNTLHRNKQNILLTELENEDNPNSININNNNLDDNDKQVVTDSTSFYNLENNYTLQGKDNNESPLKIKFLITTFLIAFLIIYSLKYLLGKIYNRT